MRNGPTALKPSLEWQGTVGSAGIVTCTAPKLLDATFDLLKHLRRLGCSLPVEAWHVGELSPSNTSSLAAYKSVQVRDLRSVISVEVAADPADLNALRGWMCKPLALIASAFDEVLLMDHDATFLSDPSGLFRTRIFLETGSIPVRLISSLLRTPFLHVPSCPIPTLSHPLLSYPIAYSIPVSKRIASHPKPSPALHRIASFHIVARRAPSKTNPHNPTHHTTPDHIRPHTTLHPTIHPTPLHPITSYPTPYRPTPPNATTTQPYGLDPTVAGMLFFRDRVKRNLARQLESNPSLPFVREHTCILHLIPPLDSTPSHPFDCV